MQMKVLLYLLVNKESKLATCFYVTSKAIIYTHFDKDVLPKLRSHRIAFP